MVKTIQTLGEMLRACMIDFGYYMEYLLLLIEFSYNDSYYTNVKATPFEVLYQREC